MSAERRVSLALLASLIMWLPSMWWTLTGDLDIIKSGALYLFMLWLAWMGTGIVSRLLLHFTFQSLKARAEDEVARKHEAEQQLSRRREDQERQAAADAQTDS